MPLNSRPLVPFGCELDVDLSVPLSTDEQTQFRKLFFENRLILARSQNLSPEDQRRLCGHIAPPIGSGDAEYISNKRPDDIFGNSAISFHSDNMYSPSPHVGISLHAIDVTEGSSSTQFTNAIRAAERMSASLRDRLRDKSVLMILTSEYGGRSWLKDQPVVPGCQWPQYIWSVLARHPETGEPYITANYHCTDSIVGLDAAGSEALLEEIFAVLYAKDEIYEHVWRNGDVIFWDNLAVQHARPAVSPSANRTLQRCAFGGKGFADMFPEIAAFKSRRSEEAFFAEAAKGA